jgi:enoyl-CoA hydratase/carnithine racemase
MSGDVLLRADAEGIALLVLNRAAKLNALDYALIDALMTALDAIDTDETIGAVIVTGAGDRAFSAGADITGFAPSIAAGTEVALRDFVARGQALTRRLESFPKPIIAAVNGIAYGGGCEIVEAMTLAIASEHARFAKPEINLGIMPCFGGTQRVPRLVGKRHALELLLTGEPITAQRAAEIGLVNKVVPHDQLLPTARALALKILEKPPLAVHATLVSAIRGLDLSITEGLALEADQFARLVPTADAREGIAAFLEKRPAGFSGK